jgi:hypothetical protein
VGQHKDRELDYKKLGAWQLRKLGYTIEQTAQALGVGVTTVKRWDKVVEKYFEDLPAIRLAMDAMQTLIPKAFRVYQDALGSKDERLAKETAKDVLISHKVLIDRQEKVQVVDDSTKSDSELVAEAERILLIARPEGQAKSDNN